MEVCSERVEIIPNVLRGANFVEAHTFRGRRSILFGLRGGNREVARCDGGDISWQAQYFVCALDVWMRKDLWQAQGIVRS